MKTAAFLALILLGCSSSQPSQDVCIAIRAEAVCNGACSSAYVFTDPRYATCLDTCAQQAGDHLREQNTCITETCCPHPGGMCDQACVVDCQSRYPVPMVPAGGCFDASRADASSNG